MTELPVFSVAALAAPHPLAAAAGRDILIEGGTLVEAALAAAMVSAAMLPERNGLGGDALWLVREAGPRGRVRVLDARGLTGRHVTARALRDLGHDAVPRHGAAAVLVAPGAVAGWAEAQALARALGGRLPLSRLLAPAIAAARGGSEPSSAEAPIRSDLADAATPDPAAAQPATAGASRPGPVLADTLDYLARAGLDDVYRGDVGRELAADLAALACPLGRDDLAATAARWRPSAMLDLGRTTVDVAPEPEAATAAAVLGLVAGRPLRDPESFEAWHGFIESLRLAPALAATLMADAGAVAAILDRGRLKRAAERIRPDRAGPGPVLPPEFPEDGIAIVAVDRDGAAVALVQTLGSAGGSGVLSGRTGILLGNRGAALRLDPADAAHLAPGRRVRLLATPMLMADRSGQVTGIAATGPHGGALVAHAAARLAAGSAAGAAAEAPRIAFGTTPDGAPALLVEDGREPEPAARLAAAGHAFATAAPGALRTLALAQRDPSGRLRAHADSGEAAVAGL